MSAAASNSAASAEPAPAAARPKAPQRELAVMSPALEAALERIGGRVPVARPHVNEYNKREVENPQPDPKRVKQLAAVPAPAPAPADRELKHDTTTDNGAASLSTSGAARLDLFFSAMVRNAPAEKVEELLAASWMENPEDAVKIVMNGRDCREGKGEKLVVFYALLWLRVNKPRTYLLNLRRFLNIGCYKDLLAICVEVYARGLPLLGQKEAIELEILAEDIREDLARLKDFKSQAGKEEKEAAESGADSAAAPEDKGKKAKGVKRPCLTLAAKWAPTEHSAFDRRCNLAGRLANLVFNNARDSKMRYRKAMSQARESLQVTERLMCAGRWDEIDFATVPSRSHHLHKKAFARHEGERYNQYLADVKSGKKEIKSVGIHPHELVGQYVCGGELDETIEEQWKAIVARVRKNGTLSNALSVVDVSGSMSGIPMNVAIALGIVTATVSSGHFQGQMITFDSSPSWFRLADGTLREQVNLVKSMPWGCSTDLQKVFDLILTAAQNGSVPQSEMPRTLFIFSDMQFDVACRGNNMTNFEVMKKKFAKAGYQMPNVVFWNLSGAISDVPVRLNESGVALISGFSPNLLKTLMENGEINPLTILLLTIAKYEAEIDPSEVGNALSRSDPRSAQPAAASSMKDDS